MTPAELRDRTAGLNWRRPSVDGGASAQSRETLRAISSAPHCVLLNCLSDYWYGFATLGDFHSMARSLPTRDPALFGVVAGQQMPSFVFFLGRDLLETPSGVLSMVSGLTVIHHKFPQTPFIYLGAVHARYAAGTKLVDCPMDGYPDWLKPLVPEFANLRCLLWCNHHKGLLYSCTADLLIMNKDNYRSTPEDKHTLRSAFTQANVLLSGLICEGSDESIMPTINLEMLPRESVEAYLSGAQQQCGAQQSGAQQSGAQQGGAQQGGAQQSGGQQPQNYHHSAH